MKQTCSTEIESAGCRNGAMSALGREPMGPVPYASRRDFLGRFGGGFGSLALTGLLGRDARSDVFQQTTVIHPMSPLAARQPHFAPRAKRVIFLFMYGGPSHIDTFDYKPVLYEQNGKPVPESIKQRAASDAAMATIKHCKDELFAGPWKFRQHGQSGLWVSELLPHLARQVDDLCVIKSMHCDSSNHAPATFQMNTGEVLDGKPSMGAWVTYGLGTLNEDLPGYVLLFDIGGYGGSGNWGSAFLPGAFQGTRFRDEGIPVLNLTPPEQFVNVQRSTIDVIQKLNAKHRAAREGLLELETRIASYELAYRMQATAMDVGDVADEPAHVLEMYGFNDTNKTTVGYARKCLMARRLVERGVRFVQVYNGIDGYGWDAHGGEHAIDKNHSAVARQTDKPIAGLLADLKQRGLLEETLVVWAGEFGRTPMMQGDNGRNHSPMGYTVWLAGGGVKSGFSYGETDEIGLVAEKDPVSVAELHATILTALGLRPDDLFFEHNGRPERLTGVMGSATPVMDVFA